MNTDTATRAARLELEEGLAHLVLYELLAPVDDAVEALAVAHRDVARLEPPVRRDAVPRRGRVVQVSLRTAQHNQYSY